MRLDGWLRAIALVAWIAGAVPAAAQAPGDPYPSNLIRVYKAVDIRTKITLGDLWLSATEAHFEQLRGRMEIRYVETLPPSADPDLSGARIYQILNYAQYFNTNRRKIGACTLPAKWVGMHDLGNMQIRVTLIVSDDFHAVVDQNQGLCAADTYRLPAQ
jgi:hypothetical protein